MKDFSIYFIKNEYFTYEKNFCLDGMKEWFFDTHDIEFSWVNIQFQKIENRMTIKLPVNQEFIFPSFSDDYELFSDMNYCCMQSLYTGQEGQVEDQFFYFFVLNKRWRGENCIEVDLVLDALNTFCSEGYRKHFFVDKKTIVKRCHKDRFVKEDGVIRAKYDYYPEEINPTLFQKTKELINDSRLNDDWYLVYESDETNGVACYLCPQNTHQMEIVAQGTNVVLDPTAINDMLGNDEVFIVYSGNANNSSSVPVPVDNGKRYRPLPIGKSYAGQFQVNFDTTSIRTFNSSYTQVIFPEIKYTYTYNLLILSKDNSNRFNYSQERWVFIYNESNQTWESTSKEVLQSGTCTSAEFLASKFVNGVISPSSQAVPSAVEDTFDEWEMTTTTAHGSTIVYLYGIDYVDRTDSKLYKIIKLPYCPAQYSKTEDEKYVFEEQWGYNNTKHMLQLADLNGTFLSEIITDIPNPLKEYRNKTYIDSSNRNDENETKLFSSEFFALKLTYDSFSLNLDLDRISWGADSSYSVNFEFNFKMTSTINSKFMFQFPEYFLNFGTEDYPNVITIARNNELPIYNNEYLNYLRTAYHYDLKAKERTISTAQLGLGLGIGGSLLSAGLGLASGNPAVAVSSVAGSGTGIASNIVSTINTIKSAEEEFAKKQEILKAQSFSVSGSDDVDIMSYYAENRLTLFTYGMSPRMRQVVADLFYYCGYATNEDLRQTTPSGNWTSLVNTRKYFNYLQCDLKLRRPCFNAETTNELIRKFGEGVTFFHRPDDAYSYDLEQVKENTEVSLL